MTEHSFAAQMAQTAQTSGLTEMGVCIHRGARPWQIFQQNETGCAEISLEGSYRLLRLSQELPLVFTEVAVENLRIQARIVWEDTGESVVPWQPCRLGGERSWSVVFSAVPAGGLYRIETSLDFEAWDGLSCTRGDMVHHIGVGDVFVIAGQSNAGGRALGPISDAAELGVHVLRASGRWDLATHPLGETTRAARLGNFENHNNGHSPWLHFAKRLKQALHYPIGLVPCSYGGSPLRWWNPDENGSLFHNMLDILRDAELCPRAILWYQGEAEGYENSAGDYFERFSRFVEHLRRALDRPQLPFVTVQLNRCLGQTSEALDRQWGLVREAQRRAWHELEQVALVPANDLALYDAIHNAVESDLIVGERCARAALGLIYGKETDWMAPEVTTLRLVSADALELGFSRVRQWLNAFELSAEGLPFDAEDEAGLCRPVAYELGRDRLTLRFARPFKGRVVLHGAWRMNPGMAIPCDCARLPMLSFYALELSEAQDA